MTERAIAAVALLVRDYDEAIDHYCGQIGLDLFEDTQLTATRRWVRVGQPSGCCLLLAKAIGSEQREAVGHQCGGRVFLFLQTPDFDADYRRLRCAGIAFVEEPREETYGKVAVFEDIYGNRWDLIEPATPS